MRSGVILAIDQGTTNTKALLVARDGRPIFRKSVPVHLIVTPEAFIEQDAQVLWRSVMEAIGHCVEYSKDAGTPIQAVAISNQRETAVAWDASTGDPVANAISWQCSRAAKLCEQLAPLSAEFRRRTGLPLSPLPSAGKWSWLMANSRRARSLARDGNLRFGTVDSWLIYQLTAGGVHATDLSNASRTGLLNLATLTWDQELLDAFSLPRAAMPGLLPSSGSFGVCERVPGLLNVPILAAIGDSHAALFGHGVHTDGTVKATYGTGSSLMALTPELPCDTASLCRTIAWSIDGATRFALEGNIPMTGSAVQWASEFLRLSDPDAVAALAETVAGSCGVHFVPAMAGLGAPYWDSDARGMICGLNRGHTAAHLARAAIEAVAFQVADVFFAMEEIVGAPFRELRADGGATRNDPLMQFQADILGRPVVRSAEEELSALGAAGLAALALGWDAGAAHGAAPARVFGPVLSAEDRACLCRGWQDAVRRARFMPEVAS